MDAEGGMGQRLLWAVLGPHRHGAFEPECDRSHLPVPIVKPAKKVGFELSQFLLNPEAISGCVEHNPADVEIMAKQ